MLTCLREMGDLAPEISSWSATCGPPGTGKSSTIAALVASILHNSRYSHFGSREHCNELKVESNHLRASTRPDCFRILVCSSSNTATDAIGEKILKGFNSNGKHYVPEVVRVARNNYDFRNSSLSNFSHLHKG